MVVNCAIIYKDIELTKGEVLMKDNVVLYTVAGVLMYAIGNVILESKLSKYNNLTLIMGYAAIVFLIITALRQVMKVEGVEFAFPTGSALVFLIVVGVVFALGDYFYIGAYTNGGKIATITSLSILLPVFASMLKFFMGKGLPNRWQVIGYAFAALAVLAIAKGSATDVIK